MISISVKMDPFMAKIKELGEKSVHASRFSALQIGYEIMRLSQLEVPHGVGVDDLNDRGKPGRDKFPGTLQNSGTVEEIDGDVIVGYHTPYAARLHEHPEYHFQHKRKGKYLEDPISRNEKILGFQFNKSFGDNL